MTTTVVDQRWIEPDDDDPVQAALEKLADGKPFVFIVARDVVDDGLDIMVNAGGGITDGTLIRNLLTATLKAVPE